MMFDKIWVCSKCNHEPNYYVGKGKGYCFECGAVGYYVHSDPLVVGEFSRYKAGGRCKNCSRPIYFRAAKCPGCGKLNSGEVFDWSNESISAHKAKTNFLDFIGISAFIGVPVGLITSLGMAVSGETLAATIVAIICTLWAIYPISIIITEVSKR